LAGRPRGTSDKYNYVSDRCGAGGQTSGYEYLKIIPDFAGQGSLSPWAERRPDPHLMSPSRFSQSLRGAQILRTVFRTLRCNLWGDEWAGAPEVCIERSFYAQPRGTSNGGRPCCPSSPLSNSHSPPGAHDTITVPRRWRDGPGPRPAAGIGRDPPV